jgi:hypothetical protein
MLSIINFLYFLFKNVLLHISASLIYIFGWLAHLAYKLRYFIDLDALSTHATFFDYQSLLLIEHLWSPIIVLSESYLVMSWNGFYITSCRCHLNDDKLLFHQICGYNFNFCLLRWVMALLAVLPFVWIVDCCL